MSRSPALDDIPSHPSVCMASLSYTPASVPDSGSGWGTGAARQPPTKLNPVAARCQLVHPVIHCSAPSVCSWYYYRMSSNSFATPYCTERPLTGCVDMFSAGSRDVEWRGLLV